MTAERAPYRHRVSRVVEAPAAAVWDVLVTFEDWPRWGPTVAAVDSPERCLGAASRGSVDTVLGLRLPFEVSAFEPGRYWAWRVAGVEATDHLVEPLDGDRCRVSFGVPAPALPYLVVCRVALARIERVVAVA